MTHEQVPSGPGRDADCPSGLWVSLPSGADRPTERGASPDPTVASSLKAPYRGSGCSVSML